MDGDYLELFGSTNPSLIIALCRNASEYLPDPVTKQALAEELLSQPNEDIQISTIRSLLSSDHVDEKLMLHWLSGSSENIKVLVLEHIAHLHTRCSWDSVSSIIHAKFSLYVPAVLSLFRSDPARMVRLHAAVVLTGFKDSLSEDHVLKIQDIIKSYAMAENGRNRYLAAEAVLNIDDTNDTKFWLGILNTSSKDDYAIEQWCVAVRALRSFMQPRALIHILDQLLYRQQAYKKEKFSSVLYETLEMCPPEQAADILVSHALKEHSLAERSLANFGNKKLVQEAVERQVVDGELTKPAADLLCQVPCRDTVDFLKMCLRTGSWQSKKIAFSALLSLPFHKGLQRSESPVAPHAKKVAEVGAYLPCSTFFP